MGGRKGKSGPPRNTNAAKYGWRVLWRRALLREQDRWVQRPIEQYIGALLTDKPCATAGEHSCVEIAATAKGCCLLILNELKQSGFTYRPNGTVELTPAARELSRFLTIELNALRTIGLERRPKPVGGTLAELLEENRGHAST